MRSSSYMYVSTHMTIHMAVLIDTLKTLRSDVCWCSCNILSTQDHTVDDITYDEYAAVFYWKGEIL